MRRLLLPILIMIAMSSAAQLKPGYDKQEARDMIALCNSFTFLDLYKTDASIVPKKYKKRYTSPVFGMDNKYQIYVCGKTAVINLRGSTDKKLSWLENISSSMIPSKGKMQVSGEIFDYCFSKGLFDAVHSGYATGIAFLRKDILQQIKNLNKEGIYDIIITGHSQGGALANMLRAYLGNVSDSEVSRKNNFKTYAFAAPMVGNKEFASSYNKQFCEDNSSFNVINPADKVPRFPLKYNDTDFLSENIKTLMGDRKSFDPTEAFTNGMTLLFEDKLIDYVNRFGASASKEMSKDVGDVVLPEYVKEINYERLGNIVEIEPAVYPRILKDSTILENDSLMAIYPKGSDRHFLNSKLYKGEPMMYQHKPYNYYATMLKMYFPNEYLRLKMKYLPENL